MNRNELRNLRAQRDHWFNLRWWVVFLVLCSIAVALVVFIDDFNLLPWFVVGGLMGMILRRRRHHQEQAARDAREDEREKAAEADAARSAKLAQAAEQLAQAGKKMETVLAKLRAARNQQGAADDDPPQDGGPRQSL